MALKDLQNDENTEAQRELAMKIIAGEYQSVVVLMYDNDKNLHSWFDSARGGGSVACLGLAQYGVAKITQRLLED
jgi:hypothetical protein